MENNKKKKISFSIKYLLFLFFISTVFLSFIFGLDIRLNKSESREIVILMLSTGMIVLGFIISMYPLKFLKQSVDVEKRIVKTSERTAHNIVKKYKINENKKNEKYIEKKNISILKYLKPAFLLLMISLIPIWIFLNLSYLIMIDYIVDNSLNVNQIIVSILIELFILLIGYYFITIINYLWTEYIVFIMESELEGWMDSLIGFFMELSKALKKNK